MARHYRESFEAAIANEIEKIIEVLRDLGNPPTSWKIYTSEIAECLTMGLLLGAVSVSGALFELFVRDLAVALEIADRFEGDNRYAGEVERKFQEDRSLTFGCMVSRLTPIVITSEDAELMRTFYQEVRNPFAHALTTRLRPDDGLITVFGDELAFLRRTGDLEQTVELRFAADLRFLVNIISKYRPWLVRRLSYGAG